MAGGNSTFASSGGKGNFIPFQGLFQNRALWTRFFIENINYFSGTEYNLHYIVLPLAISFLSFQQISYLVEAYKTRIREYNFANYCLYVSFFPKLISGPITYYKELIPQFGKIENKYFQWDKFSIGIYVFSIGLFKKVFIADTLSVWVTTGFNAHSSLSFFSAWATSFSYTFQLYFDFSGYIDMAIGSAYMLNIYLPINFNSPYKSLNIQEFWRRWHITLSRFLRDYLYIPLGGNRLGNFSTYRNIMFTFLLGGLWHGAGWTFVIWGGLHGIGAVILRIWRKIDIKMPKWMAWIITMNYVNICWVFFRADNLQQALNILKGMFGFNSFILPRFLDGVFQHYLNHYATNITFGNPFADINGHHKFLYFFIFASLIIFLTKNSMQLMDRFKPSYRTAISMSLIISLSLLSMISSDYSPIFLYFRF